MCVLVDKNSDPKSVHITTLLTDLKRSQAGLRQFLAPAPWFKQHELNVGHSKLSEKQPELQKQFSYPVLSQYLPQSTLVTKCDMFDKNIFS